MFNIPFHCNCTNNCIINFQAPQTEMFVPLKFLSVYFKGGKVINDNGVFRLHCRITFAILVMFGSIVTMTQFVGKPIHCIFEGIPQEFVNSFCWIHSTFTIHEQQPSQDNWTPFVVTPMSTRDRFGNYIVKHRYYQWIYFVLFLQALSFYVPRFLWKSCIGNTVTMLLQDLPTMKVLTYSKKRDQVKKVATYLVNQPNTLTALYFKFICCQALNLINVAIQMCFMHILLGGQFFSYGYDILMGSLTTDKLVSYLFPKVTKCTIHKFGASGTLVLSDGMCILPLNTIHEKMYAFLWFWFWFVAFCTLCSIINDVLRMICFSIWKKGGTMNPGIAFAMELLRRNLDNTTIKEIIVEYNEMIHQKNMTKT